MLCLNPAFGNALSLSNTWAKQPAQESTRVTVVPNGSIIVNLSLIYFIDEISVNSFCELILGRLYSEEDSAELVQQGPVRPMQVLELGAYSSDRPSLSNCRTHGPRGIIHVHRKRNWYHGEDTFRSLATD